MALKAIMLRKKIDDAKKKLEALNTREEELKTREAEIETAIEESETEEEREAVESEIEGFEADKTALAEEKETLEREIEELEGQLEEEEKEQKTDAPAEPKARKKEVEPKVRTRDMNEIIMREDVKAFLGEVRSAIKEKRAITGVGAIIPEVMLGLLRQNIAEYSKLYRHVSVRPITGNGRLPIMGAIPEAVWTECCANLNEMDLDFALAEFGCWKVGGYYAICDAILEDSDIDLASEIMTALGQGIGMALDKAILYGTGARMPLGVVTRLAQTTEPADYPTTARTWVDLHTSNIKAINSASMTAAELFAAITTAFGGAKGKYSRGEKVFVMNEKTYTALAAQAVSVTAAGTIVTGVFDRMPVIGGIIEVLDFVPDNVIIGGYFDLYTLAERAGQKFAESEHVRFLADQTIMKGTARYDGQPVIAEGFVAIGINNTTPTASMTFAPDTANAESE